MVVCVLYGKRIALFFQVEICELSWELDSILSGGSTCSCFVFIKVIECLLANVPLDKKQPVPFFQQGFHQPWNDSPNFVRPLFWLRVIDISVGFLTRLTNECHIYLTSVSFHLICCYNIFLAYLSTIWFAMNFGHFFYFYWWLFSFHKLTWYPCSACGNVSYFVLFLPDFFWSHCFLWNSQWLQHCFAIYILHQSLGAFDLWLTLLNIFVLSVALCSRIEIHNTVVYVVMLFGKEGCWLSLHGSISEWQ